MLSTTLMKQTIKSNFILFMVITIVQALCLILMATVSESVAATGQSYYQMLPGILMTVYIVVTGNKLLAAQIDRGTMAYILSTPIRRSKVALTQAIYFVLSLFLMFTISAAAHIIASKIALASFTSEDMMLIIKLNVGLFALALVFSPLVFLIFRNLRLLLVEELLALFY